jgi:hypothetical protein
VENKNAQKRPLFSVRFWAFRLSGTTYDPNEAAPHAGRGQILQQLQVCAWVRAAMFGTCAIEAQLCRGARRSQ